MDNEIMALMQLLSKKAYVTLKDIEHSANITRRQAMYRIDKVNDLLRLKQAEPIVIGATKELQVTAKAKQTIELLLSEMNLSKQYYMSKKERHIYMYIMLFMNREYVSLNDFIDCLDVSRSTVLMDLKELSQTLEEYGIRIHNNRKRGYYLVGSEMEIRRVMMKDVIYTLAEEQNAKVFDVLIDDFHLDIFDYSRLVITELAQRHNIRFVEDRLVEFIYIFIFLKARMQSGVNAEDELSSRIDLEAISSMKEYEFTVELLKNYKNTDLISETDIKYITSWILGISFGDIHEDTKDCVLISDIIGKIMMRFEYLSGAHYRNTEEIFIQLYSHFRPAYYRLLCKLPIFNPLCDKVREEYKELYQLVEETMKPFYVIFGEKIPEGEIAYLTLHFAGIYSDKKDFAIAKQKTALVVCSNGIGSSAILYNELTRMFPELYFYPPLETSHVRDISEQVDIIFSTRYVTLDSQIHTPIIRVSPVMSMAERYQVMREVYMQMGSHFLKQPNVDVVMGIIAKYADIHEEQSLYNELITYFAHIDGQAQEEAALHLCEMVKPECICLQVEASDWEEAVRKAYKPMVAYGYITQGYVEETISSVRILGPYIVVTKSVALPHAKPEAGALAAALGICVLKTPIEFGNRDNDPVKYIFSLSAVDNQKHLCAMAELLEMFNTPKFFDMLEQAENSEEVMTFLSGKEEESDEF